MRVITALSFLLLHGCALLRAGPETYDPVTRDSGLVVQDVVIPEGLVAERGDRVTFHYHGSLSDGTVFDSTVERGRPVTITLGESEFPAILEDGIVGMHARGKRLLTATAESVFPAGNPPGVPPRALLLFEVELLQIEDDAAP